MSGSAIGIASVPVNMLLLFYLTQVVGLRPGMAGLLVGLPKIWDIVVDPPLGGWVDRISARIGRRATIALVAGLIHVIVLYLLFSIPVFEPEWLLLGLLFLLLIGESVTQTAFRVSQLALANDMTGDPGERTVLFAFSGVMAAILTLLVTATVPYLIELGGGGAQGYSRMAAIVALLGAAGFAAFALATWRYRTHPAANDQAPAPVFSAIRATLENRPFYCLIGFLVCFGVTAGLIGAFVPYINQYILHGGTSGLAVLGSIVLVATIGAMPITAMAAKRFGNMRVLMAANLLIVLSFPAMFIASYGPIWASWGTVAMFGLGAGGLALVLQSVSIDLAKRPLGSGVVVSLGVYMGVLVAGQKLGQSAGGMLAGFVLDVIGFVPGASRQAAATLLTLRIGYTLVPFVLLAIGGFLLWRIMPAALLGRRPSSGHEDTA